jgi:hypothetical protein
VKNCICMASVVEPYQLNTAPALASRQNNLCDKGSDISGNALIFYYVSTTLNSKQELKYFPSNLEY